MNRLGLVWTCLLALAAAFATACPAPSPTATPVTAQYPLEFTTIEQSLGHMPYFYDKAPRLLVIASSREAQTDVPLYLYPEFQRPNDPGDTVT
ncbi:MAG: hypothetical protein Q7T04_04535, partial [Dehalococcoidia bacterium]|nr:hypothetical protein [Dehalococcoidia bacterium]